MATDIKSEPASERPSMNLDQATDAISQIMRSSVADEAPPAPPQQALEDPDVPVAEEPGTNQTSPQDMAETEAGEGDPRDSLSEAKEPPDKDAENESATEGAAEDTDEIELDPQQLASLHGLDEDDLVIDDEGSIRIRAKVDGKVSEVPISELKDSYQLAKTSQQRLQQLAEERKTFEEERKTVTEQLTQQHQMMTDALTAIEQQYAHDWQQVDWKRLREEDPERYTIMRQDYDERMRQISAFKQGVEQRQQQQLLEKQELQQRLWQEGAMKLNDAFVSGDYKSAPKWDEPEKQRLMSWMTEQGFTQKDISEVSSWLVFKWARDSMLRKDDRAAAKKAVKRVVKLPKVKTAKPGAKEDARKSAKKNAVQEARARQRKSGGDMNSTTELIRSIFNS